jgi:hypothetical protein
VAKVRHASTTSHGHANHVTPTEKP